MATVTISTADALLKDVYIGPIVEQINQKTYMLDQIERDSDSIDHTGRRAIVPVHVNRNRGRGSRADGGTLPVAGSQTDADAVIGIKRHYYAIELTDGVIEATKSNEGAFVNLLDRESKAVATDMRKDMNRQIFGTGDGLLASVTVTATNVTVVSLDSVQYIGIGDPVSVLVRSSGATQTNSENSIVARTGGATKTVQFASAVTVDATHGVYISGNRSQESDGLRNISATTSRSLHGIDSTTAGNEYWNPQVTAVSGVAGETSFEILADNIGLTGQGEVEVFLTTRGIRRRLADTYQSQKRFNDAQAVNVHGGYSAIMVNEVPVIADDDCPTGFAFGLDKSAFRWVQQAGPGWLTDPKGNGSIFSLKDSSTAGQKVAAWQAWLKWYAALACVAPQRTGALTSVTDTNPT